MHFEPDRFEVRPRTSDKAVVDEVMERRIYLKNFILSYVKPNALIIDIGAHIGSFTIQSCLLLCPRLVVAIEPENGSFNYLRRNIAKAKIDHLVKPMHIALWSSRTEGSLYCEPSIPSCNSLIPSWHNWLLKLKMADTEAPIIQKVRTDTLDNTLKSLGLAEAAIDILKIDVEGAEQEVLKGAVAALRRCRIVVGELHEAFLPEYELRSMLKNFKVFVGEPITSLGLRYFWGIKSSILRSEGETRKFHRLARAADAQESRWRAEQLENKIDSLYQQLFAIQDSLSWKLSAPLRTLLKPVVSAARKSSSLDIHISSNPLVRLLDPSVRRIFTQIIEERLNNDLLSYYFRLGERVDAYAIKNQRVGRKDLAARIVEFLAGLVNRTPIDSAKAFWKEFSFNSVGTAGVPVELSSIERAYSAIYQKTTGVTMISDLLKSANLRNGVIVDVGCWDNELNLAILDHADRVGLTIDHAIGTDVVQMPVTTNDRRLEFRAQSSQNMLPVQSDYADLVISKWSLHHITQTVTDSIISEIGRVLRPGGKAVIIEALAGSYDDLHNGFQRETKDKTVWPEGPWNEVRKNLTEEYLRLQLDQQKAVLALEDFYGHWLEGRRIETPLHFTYMTHLEANRIFGDVGLREMVKLRRGFGYAPIIHKGPPSIRLVYSKPSAA
jgi:FkbM family methyltransferase